MLTAVVEDIQRIPGWEVVTTVSRQIPFDVVCDVTRIDSVAHERVVFDAMLKQVDATLIIAPETDGVLADRCRRVQKSAAVSWNCSVTSIELCSDKFQLCEHLQSAGILTIPTVNVALDHFPNFESWNWKNQSTSSSGDGSFVLKPRDGAGSQSTYLIRSKDEWDAAIQQIRLLQTDTKFICQPFMIGRPISVGVMIRLDGKQRFQLPACVQHLSNNGRFAYQGGQVPAEISSKVFDRINATVEQTCQSIPGLAGYFGLDLLVTNEDEVVVVEINPRLTTSYVAYRQLYSTRLPGYWIDPMSTPVRNSKFASAKVWMADGQVQVTLSETLNS